MMLLPMGDQMSGMSNSSVRSGGVRYVAHSSAVSRHLIMIYSIIVEDIGTRCCIVGNFCGRKHL